MVAILVRQYRDGVQHHSFDEPAGYLFAFRRLGYPQPLQVLDELRAELAALNADYVGTARFGRSK